MLELLDRIRREWEIIRQAPFSFLIVSAILCAICWTGFHYSYAALFGNATEEARHWHETADRWQSDASYYQDVAKRSASEQIQPVPLPAKQIPPPAPAKGTPKSSRKPVTEPNGRQVSAPNGVAVGGDNNGTINNGAVPRSLSSATGMAIGNSIGSPSADFDGIFCVMGDSESCRLADQIRQIFAAHGWPHTEGLSQGVYNNPLPGIFVAIGPADAASPPPAVLQVYNAFRSNGINVLAIKVNNVKPGHFYVLVGDNLPPP